MSNTCNFRTSEASTKSWFRTNGLIDRFLNIPEGKLIEFRKQNTIWSDYAAKQYGITGRLFTEEAAGKKAVPNKEMFYKIDAAKGIFYPANAYLQTAPQQITEPVLVNQVDIDRFNTVVERNNGLKPSEFYTSDKDFDAFTNEEMQRTQEDRTASKWLLNEEGLYDLVDQFTDQMYLRNVDLSTGKQVTPVEDTAPVNNSERNKFIKSLRDGVSEYRLDEILAERGYDITEIMNNLEAATTQKEYLKIVTNVLKNIC